MVSPVENEKLLPTPLPTLTSALVVLLKLMAPAPTSPAVLLAPEPRSPSFDPAESPASSPSPSKSQ